MLRFDITDANDNNPYFTKCPRDPIRLPEDTGVGNKLIMVVRAKDNDRINGDNPSPFGEIRYQIQGTRFYSFTDTEIACRIKSFIRIIVYRIVRYEVSTKNVIFQKLKKNLKNCILQDSFL